MSIITLTTDFGTKDHFIGAMKGKILSYYPEAKIIDISHDIDTFNIIEASYIISAAYASFPKGTIHIIGVDSELSPTNLHIAMEWNDHYFICADNGILSMLTQKMVPQKIVQINIHDRLHAEASDMEVFVMVGTHLAKGGLLNVIGKEMETLKEANEIQPTVTEQQINGHVIYIDHFGNVVTNISKKLFLEVAKNRSYKILFRGKTLKTILPKYNAILIGSRHDEKFHDGEKLAIFNEAGYLEIALYRSNPLSVGSASTLLGLNYLDTVVVSFN
jgi:S-adenosylmethionine hydrolase